MSRTLAAIRFSSNFKFIMTANVELLSPAGCYPSLQAAIDAGADAVYFGLSKLNMRSRARHSFRIEDIPQIKNRCQAGGVKCYLTLNTLLYDRELGLARKILTQAARYDIDAVIVSDMSAMQLAQELGLEIHFSTQLSISNYQAVKFYAQYGDRIVLARELDLQRIAKICAQIQQDDLRGCSGKPMEIEVFAHGALCIALSGRCGMSLFNSQRSANRGACEQYCRREYTVIDRISGREMVLDNNYIMSPNDICTIDFLDQVVETGVGVLKIEGRGRGPEYTYTITKAYRQTLQALYDGRYKQDFVDQVLEDIKTVFHRGLSSGYYLGREQGWSAAYGSKASRKKIVVGAVTNYFRKPSVAEIHATDAGFSVGDDYLIIGRTTGVIKGVVEEIHLNNEPVTRVEPKALCTLKVPSKVRVNDKVYMLKRPSS
jgi:U32 family peptidase